MICTGITYGNQYVSNNISVLNMIYLYLGFMNFYPWSYVISAIVYTTKNIIVANLLCSQYMYFSYILFLSNKLVMPVCPTYI